MPGVSGLLVMGDGSPLHATFEKADTGDIFYQTVNFHPGPSDAGFFGGLPRHACFAGRAMGAFHPRKGRL
jgi:hypothetical protein